MSLFAPPDQKYIQCDAEGCGTASPQLRCSRCRLVHYCSKECQRNNWPAHKSDCIDVNVMKAKLIDLPHSFNKTPVEMSHKVNNAAADVCCGICLEDVMQSPHALSNCQHIFCYPCLQSYQTMCKRMQLPLLCPLCRTETEDVQRNHWELAFFNVCKADRQPESSPERAELLHKAIAELELISKDDVPMYTQALFTKITALEFLEDYETVLNVIDEIIQIDNSARETMQKIVQMLEDAPVPDDDEVDQVLEEANELTQLHNTKKLSAQDRIELFIQKASTYEKLENWTMAFQSYKNVYSEYDRLDNQGTPPQNRKVYMGASCCLYHQGQFDGAIELGMGAIEMNRHFPGVHKYVALSYKAKGDLESAKKIMTQAVLYETPWDEKNIHQQKLLLNELMNMNE